MSSTKRRKTGKKESARPRVAASKESADADADADPLFWQRRSVGAVLFLDSGFTVASVFYAFGFFVVPLEKEFGWSRTEINVGFSMSLSVSALFGLLLGTILDRAPRSSRLLLVLTMLIPAIGNFLRAYVSTLGGFYFAMTLSGIGFHAGASILLGRLVSVWYPDNKGTVLGIISSGFNVNGFLITPLAEAIITSYGWRACLVVFATYGVILAVVTFFLVSSSPEEARSKSKSSPSPSKSTSTSPSSSEKAAPAAGLTLAEALRWRGFYLLMAALVFGALNATMVATQLTPHLVNVGFTASEASYALMIFSIAGMLSKLLFGFVAAKSSARMALCSCFAMQALGVAAIIITKGSRATWLSVPLFGLGYGAFGPLQVLGLLESVGSRAYGKISGILSALNIIPSIVGPILIGTLYDLNGGYTEGFGVMIGVFAFCIISVLAMGKKYKFD